MRRGFCAVALMCAAGCGKFGEHPKSPAQGGSPWVEVVSDHFTVVSDLPRPEAESTARELEEGLDGLTQIAFEHPRIPVERTTVVVFHGESDFHAFIPARFDGLFSRSLHDDPEGPRFVIVHDFLTQETRTTFFHELTHDLIERNLGATPVWLNEGWADYYSTLRVDGGSIVIGEAPRRITFTVDRNYSWFRDRSGKMTLAVPIDVVPPPSELVKMSHQDFYRTEPGQNVDEGDLAVEARYIGAWAFVHMLVDGSADYQRRFRSFYAGLTQGKSFDEAYRAAFGDLPPARIDRDFRRYLDAGDLALFRSRYQPPKTPFTYAVRTLTDAEIHLYWARLTPWTGKSADTALRDLDAAVAAAPSSPEPHYYRGLFWLARGNLRSAEEELARATQVSPNEPRFLLATLVLRTKQYELASGAPDEGPVREAAERLGGVARTPNELNTAAVTLEALSQLDQALPLAKRAVALAPYDADILDTYASVLFNLGHVDEAVDVQTAAVSFLDEHTDESALRERLERYRRSVVATPAPPENADGDGLGR